MLIHPHLMKKSLLPFLLFSWFMLLVGTVSANPQSPCKTVLRLEQQWCNSIRNNDPKPLLSILSDKMIYVTAQGRVLSKSAILSETKITKWESAAITSVRTLPQGDTVIATGVFTGREIVSGKLMSFKHRWTDTWVRVPSGHWQCIASQSTALKD